MTEEKASKNNRLLIGAVIGLFVLAICCALMVVVIAAGLIFSQGQDEIFGEPPEDSPRSSLDENQSDSSTPAPTPEPSAIQTEMDSIRDIVMGIRGLDLQYDIPRSLMTYDELYSVVEEDFFEEYSEEDARDDAVVLYAFDVVPLDFDLYQFYLDFYADGIAGFYDPEIEEFFVIVDSGDFSVDNELTTAHEYVHVFQDQNFDLDVFMKYDDDNWYYLFADEASARQALVEGDATVAELIYLDEYMSTEDLTELYEYYEGLDLSFYDEAPQFIVDSFLFPYTDGAVFVQTLYDQGGFDLINSAFTDPPTSTEQILHPEKYLAEERDEPQIVELEDGLAVLDGGYRETYISQMGEFGIRSYLSQRLRDTIVTTSAAGWDGDRYVVYINDNTDEVVLIWRVIWDTPEDTQEFIDGFALYASDWSSGQAENRVNSQLTCWGTEEVLCIGKLNDSDTLVIRAPDVDTVLDLFSQY